MHLRPPAPLRPANEGAPPSPRRVRLARPGVLALALITGTVVVFLILIWSAFGSFDPALGRLSPSAHPLFFPVLMVHIVASSLAMLTAVLQLWPGFRRHRPRGHRTAVRLYVFAGVLPAAVTALALTVVWPLSPLATFREFPMELLWIAVTAYGFALVARGRTADCRRWMLRSVALTFSVMLNPLLDLVVRPMLAADVPTYFAGSDLVYGEVADATRLWLATFITFVAVEWWLERDPAFARAK